MKNKQSKKTASTTIRLPKEWKELIKEYQDNNDGISRSSGTMSAYIIQAIKEKMIRDNLI